MDTLNYQPNSTTALKSAVFDAFPDTNSLVVFCKDNGIPLDRKTLGYTKKPEVRSQFAERIVAHQLLNSGQLPNEPVQMILEFLDTSIDLRNQYHPKTDYKGRFGGEYLFPPKGLQELQVQTLNYPQEAVRGITTALRADYAYSLLSGQSASDEFWTNAYKFIAAYEATNRPRDHYRIEGLRIAYDQRSIPNFFSTVNADKSPVYSWYPYELDILLQHRRQNMNAITPFFEELLSAKIRAASREGVELKDFREKMQNQTGIPMSHQRNHLYIMNMLLYSSPIPGD